MLPRAGVTELSSTNPLSVVMPVNPMPTPITAVSSGMPAASSEPNVMTRTTRAMATPMTSAEPPMLVSFRASPPMAMSRPASFATSREPSRASRSASLSPTVGSV